MNPFDWLFRLINEGVERFFAIDNVALWIALALLAGCAAIILRNARAYVIPLRRQLDARLAATDPVAEAASAGEARRLFAERFAGIDAAMAAPDGPPGLAHAWTQFRETIIAPDETPLRVTARPEAYFLHIGDDGRVLAWWANIFVAIGLTFTFLGIVAALHKTVEVMSSGADQAGMLAALTGLLRITAAKFWTSIGGVGASIILRLFDRRWHAAIAVRLDRLCERIGAGTLYVPGQRFAAEQLRALEALPARMADAFAETMRPVARGLSDIHASVEELRAGGVDRIGAELGQAITQGAGSGMADLAGALVGITRGLEGVNGRLLDASSRAGEEIAASARAFADTFAAMRGQAAEAGAALSGSVNAAADRNAEVLARAAAALEAATARTAEGMGAAIDHAVDRSVEESARLLSASFAVFGERFEDAHGGFVAAIDGVAARISALAEAVVRAVGATDAHADALATAGREVQGAAAMLSRAASDVAAASTPIRQATETVGQATGATHAILQGMDQRGAEQVRVMQGIAASLEQTDAAASSAWASYRDRFEEVDQALARAIGQIAGLSAEHATRLNEHVERIDGALAQAVERLAQVIAPLARLADRLERGATP